MPAIREKEKSARALGVVDDGPRLVQGIPKNGLPDP
jgi:hypothetical protein